MRILLDQVVHDHRNKGNNALLLVALNRLRAFWPHASFDVLSVSPHFCRVFLDRSRPVSPDALRPLRTNLDGLHRVLPPWVWLWLFEAREQLEGLLQRPLPPVSQPMGPEAVPGRGGPSPRQAGPDQERESPVRSPIGATTSPDGWGGHALYVATGGGYLCDTDKRFVLPLFARIESAVKLGTPVVMVGQGVGPLTDPELTARARQVLPLVSLILVREEANTRLLLESLDVPAGRIVMTGDDALELAYDLRPGRLGNSVGISLRANPATAVTWEHVGRLRGPMQEAAARWNVPMVGAPISFYRHEADIHPIDAVIGDRRRRSSWRRFEALAPFIGRIGRCRIMVSGTFHAAAFALAQGIPVVALAHSEEYRLKLAGLQAEFGEPGCQLLSLQDAHFERRFADALEVAWGQAPLMRHRLLESAQRQIDLGRQAYRSILDLLAPHTRPEPTLGHPS